jgi:glycerol-3-phosphate acyltransferase PlsX
VLRIAIDAMSGERAPNEVVRGAALASLDRADVELIVVGDTPRIGKVLSETRHDAERIRIHHAGQRIRNDERAAEALAANPDASLTIAARLVAAGEADAMVSAASPAAALLTCSRHFKPIAGVSRPALSAVYPTEMRRGEKDDPFALLLDVGAALDASAEELVTFALMGAAYAARISRHPRPRVAFLSSGAEPGAQSQVIAAANQLLLAYTGLNFVGTIDGTDIARGGADVVVATGNTGSLALRLLEHSPESVLALARYAYKDQLLWRVAFRMLEAGVQRLKRLTDWAEYGGAPVLGYDRVYISAHRRSGGRAIANAIKVCGAAVQSGVVGAIRGEVEALAGRMGRQTSRQSA